MEHHFDVDHAVEFGIEEAIVIYNFRFWLLQNKANHRNIKKIEIDGKKVERYFTYNSAKALSELFPYLNPKQIYRVMESLEKQGVLIKKYFNSNTYNRTSWYCFKDENRFLKVGNAIPENGKSISRKQEMEIPKSGNHDTDNKPDIKPDNKNKEQKVLLSLEEENSLSLMNLKTKFIETLKENGLTYNPGQKDARFNYFTIAENNMTPQELIDLIPRLIQVKKDNPNDKFFSGICWNMSDLISYKAKINNAHKPKVLEFKQQEKKAPAKFSNTDLDALKEFLA